MAGALGRPTGPDDLGLDALPNAGRLSESLRDTIENRPYAAVAIALGLGWLFGRTHRPF
jgi:hypothetical protein